MRPITGESGKRMKDDSLFSQKPDSLIHLETDPGCESIPVWREFREKLYRPPNEVRTEEQIRDYRGQASTLFIHALAEDEGKTDDQLARDCTLGFVTALYFIAQFSLKFEKTIEYPRSLLHGIDMYTGLFHPGTFNRFNHRGLVWPINIADIAKLHRDVLRLSGYSADPKKYPGEELGGYDFDTDEDFKVYVYDTDEVPELEMLLEGASYCKGNQWAAEVVIHQFLLQSKVLTSDPTEADFFFVPQYSSCLMFTAAKDGFREVQSDALFRKIINRLPYFAKTNGRNHIFVFSGGHGVDGPFASWRKYIKDSIFIMIEPELWNHYHTQTEGSYNIHKDILIPGRIMFEMVNAITGYSNLWLGEDREFLADFVGWNRPLHISDDGSKSPREVLLSMADNPNLHIRQDVPFDESLIGSSSSSFCFIPRGFSAWTSRIFRVLFANCIPVILNDRLEIPFSELLPVHEWTIKWPMKNIDRDELLYRLEEIRNDTKLYHSMLHALERDRCWFVFPPSRLDFDYQEVQLPNRQKNACPRWKKENAFLATMKLLGRKKRVTRSSDDTFYFPSKNGTVYMDKNFNILP